MITLTERSREWLNETCIWHMLLKGTADDVVARNYVLTNTPSTYEGLVRGANVSIDPQTLDASKGRGIWDVTVTYESQRRVGPEPSQSEIGSVTIMLSTSGGRTNVKIPLDRREYDAAGPVAEVSSAPIGYQPDGAVDGVEIEIPVFRFSVRKVWSIGSCPSYNELYALTQKVNSSSVTIRDTTVSRSITFAPGELRFLGAQIGGAREDGAVEVVYEFEAIENIENYTVPGTSITIDKLGHEYPWAYYYKTVDDSNHEVLVPWRMVIDQVYYTANLNALDI